MSFNDSFQNMEFDNEENINNLSFGQEDIKFSEKSQKSNKIKKTSEINTYNNINDNYTDNNNIFSSLAMELESDDNLYNNNDNRSNTNNYYIDILSKEMLKYSISNLFNIINNKKIIIKSKIFYYFKKLYQIKLTNSIKAEILFLRISSSLKIIFSIIKNQRKTISSQIFNRIKRNYLYNKDRKEIMDNNSNNNPSLFKSNYELNYKKEKTDIIKENTNNIKSIEKDIQLIKKNINQLTTKETALKAEIYSYLQKEKKLNEQIKNIESINSSLKKSLQLSETISTRTINKFDNDVLSLENAINANKQLKQEKEEIIKIFMNKVNKLLNEYQIYINNIKNMEESNNNSNNNNLLNSCSNTGKESNDNSNSPFSSNFSSKNLSHEV